MEIKWTSCGELELPLVNCPVCKKNRLKNDEKYYPYELFMHLKSRAHKTRDLADLIQEEAHFNEYAFNSFNY